MRLLLFISGLLLLACLPVLAQDEGAGEEPIDERFTIDTPVTLDFEQEEEEEPKKKKKKVKKKVFYGVKTKKRFHTQRLWKPGDL